MLKKVESCKGDRRVKVCVVESVGNDKMVHEWKVAQGKGGTSGQVKRWEMNQPHNFCGMSYNLQEWTTTVIYLKMKYDQQEK